VLAPWSEDLYFYALRKMYNSSKVCARLGRGSLKGLSARLGVVHIVGGYSERLVLDSIWS
jgi:hypothetical protein